MAQLDWASPVSNKLEGASFEFQLKPQVNL